MTELFQFLLSKSWEFFQIPWPGFDFSIGSVFLAVLVSSGALTAVAKMTGVSLPNFSGVSLDIRGFSGRGGNNSLIKISEERRLDRK